MRKRKKVYPGTASIEVGSIPTLATTKGTTMEDVMTQEQRAQYEEIKRGLSKATSRDLLLTYATIYVFDLRFSRRALAEALHDVEIEKGWRAG